MSAFVTGGTGFIGKRLVRRLMRTHRQHLVDRRPDGAAAKTRLCL
jgi:nucleoside-diphosphate-sugar epimerase